MKAPRGMLFLQLSSTVLLLGAATLYQNRVVAPGTASAQRSKPSASQRDVYVRYESVLRLLESKQPIAAAELLQSFPEEALSVENVLLKDSGASFSPAMLFLRTGRLFARYATEAAYSGSAQQAKLLVDTCKTLQSRLERGGSHSENLGERAQRFQVSRLLERCAQRAELALRLYQSS